MWHGISGGSCKLPSSLSLLSLVSRLPNQAESGAQKIPMYTSPFLNCLHAHSPLRRKPCKQLCTFLDSHMSVLTSFARVCFFCSCVSGAMFNVCYRCLHRESWWKANNLYTRTHTHGMTHIYILVFTANSRSTEWNEYTPSCMHVKRWWWRFFA